MTLIQTPNPGRRLQLGLNLEGPPPTPTLNPELQPVVLVDDFTKLDFQSPGYERAAGGYVYASGGGAGTYAFAFLRNPTGSGMLCTVTGIWAGQLNVSNLMLNISIFSLDPGGSPAGVFRDSRFITQAVSKPACGVAGASYSGAFTAYGTAGMQMVYSANSYMDFSPLGPWVLQPGWSIGVFQTQANVDVIGSFAWTERVLNAQEK